MTEEFRQKLIDRYSHNKYIEFDGFNCYDLDEDWIKENGECPGWDGQDRRCFCGNRRVMWVCRVTPETENVEDWYAEAY